MAVAIIPVIDRDVENLKFFQRLAVQSRGLNISLQAVSGDLGQPFCRQDRIQRLVAHGDDDSLFSSLPAVQAGVAEPHVPGGRIGLIMVAASSPLKPDFIQMLSNADIRLKLGNLDRSPVISQISDPHDHEFHVPVLIHDILHDHVEGCGCFEAGSSHGARDIQSQDHGHGPGMLVIVTALPDDFVRIQCGIQTSGRVHILSTPHSGCVYMAVRTHISSPHCGIFCKILSSPISSTHFRPP